MNTYTVIESKLWEHTSGRRVSAYGALPWYGEEEKKQWSLTTVGWTVRNNQTGTIGIGRIPWETQEQAQLWINGLSK